jgi:hypothetical protein
LHFFCGSILVHLSKSLFLSSLSILYRHVYSFQHKNYISCRYANSNDTSKGELTTYRTSVVLNDLLPYSWYSVEVAAYTVLFGRAAVIKEHTVCLGKLF